MQINQTGLEYEAGKISHYTKKRRFSQKACSDAKQKLRSLKKLPKWKGDNFEANDEAPAGEATEEMAVRGRKSSE
jgi:hypothetical protein